MLTVRALTAAALFATLPACGIFPTGGTDGGKPSSVSDAGNTGYGFSSPALQVTINGVHFGPGTPDSGSGAAYVNQRDSSGRVFQSSFQMVASSQSAQAACSLNIQRIGQTVSPISTGAGYVLGSNALITPDGEVDPGQGEAVQIPQGTWQCAGSSCDGGAFVLTALDEKHVEGYLTGAFDNYVAGTNASVVCAFNVPMLTYSP